MALIEKGQCLITHLDEQACGIGKTAMGIIKIPYSLPGEIVEFERHSYRQVTSFILKHIVKPLSSRITPTCQYFSACGGCSLQHMNITDYNSYKIANLNNILAKNNITATDVKPLVTIPPHTRRRANLTAFKKNNMVYLGFKRFHTHQVINIDSCVALSEKLSKLIIPLKLLINDLLDNKHKIQIYLTEASNGIDLLFETALDYIFDKTQYDKINGFIVDHDVIQFNIVNKNNIMAQPILSITKIAPIVKFGKFDVEINAKNFLQATLQSDQILSRIVIQLLNLTDNRNRVIDLFCGSGTFTLSLTEHVCHITGVECDDSAIKNLNNTITRYNINNIDIINRDLFRLPMSSSELREFNYCIINPPRAGAKAQCYELRETNITKIIYVSCNMESFVEDAKILLKSNLQLVSITPIDQFYWNAHLEIIALFTRQ